MGSLRRIKTSSLIPDEKYIFENVYECKDCPPGHKCGFAAAEPVPCPLKEFNSHFNQTTCQQCDQYFGEYCPEGSGKFFLMTWNTFRFGHYQFL